MECKFMVGDSAVTNIDGVLERYRGLTCRIVDVVDDDGDFVRIVFDEDPNGDPGRVYTATADSLTRLCGDESDCEAISEFLNDM